MGFSRRLILLLVVVLLAVQLLCGALVYAFLRGHLIEQGKRQMAGCAAALTHQMAIAAERIATEITVLAQDYPLRRAIADSDHYTVLSTLHNHGRRVAAAEMLVIGLDGRVHEDTGAEDGAPADFPYPGLLDGAVVDGSETALVARDEGAYWLVVVPVKAPTPIAYVAAMVRIDDAQLENLRSLSGIAVSVRLAVARGGGGWSIVAGSERAAADLPPVGPATAEATLRAGGNGEYLTLIHPLETARPSPTVAAVLDYPLSDALGQLKALFGVIALVLVAGLSIAVLGTSIIARGVSRPIEALAATARRIGAGDYGDVPATGGSDEVGQLSAAFATMVRAVREREAALVGSAGELARARDAAQRASEAKSEFLANMSHELRTPLNAVIGFSDLIRNEISGPIEQPDYVRFAGYVHEGGEKLLRLVDQMLSLVRLDREAIEPVAGPVELGEVLQATLRALDKDAAAAGVGLPAVPVPAAGTAVSADAAALGRAFHAVIANGIKFTPAGGKITIAVERRGRWAATTVRDTGIGIKPEDLPHVTEPFYRVSSALDGRYQGAGLGLSLARKIVEALGGRLQIESAFGSGTAVTILLPLRLDPAPAPAPERVDA